MAAKKMLALDVGTSSVRALLGEFDGGRLDVREIARFENAPVATPAGVVWDMLGIFQRIEEVLEAACRAHEIDSVAVDSWGTDMVALDRHGELLTNGVSTRDPRFDGVKEEFFRIVPRRELYRRTGIQFLDWNSVYLLYDLARRKPWLVDAIGCMLFAPDFFAYMLTGERACDYTIASTSQMLDPYARTWDEEIAGATGLRDKLLEPALGAGPFETRRRYGGRRLKVYLGASHDTAAAVAGTPLSDRESMYIIAGSWAMVGAELPAPIISDLSERYGFSNEGSVDGSIRFLKNVMGMWLIQESRRAWAREGRDYGFAEIARLGQAAEPLRFLVDVDDARFRPEGDIPARVRALCREAGRDAPETDGQVVRCIVDSLALRFRSVKAELEACAGRGFRTVHLVAGGSQDAALCQAVADATGCLVLAHPVEASAFGNCAVQLIRSGCVRDLAEARRIIRDSAPPRAYEPRPSPQMEAARAGPMWNGTKARSGKRETS